MAENLTIQHETETQDQSTLDMARSLSESIKALAYFAGGMASTKRFEGPGCLLQTLAGEIQEDVDALVHKLEVGA